MRNHLQKVAVKKLTQASSWVFAAIVLIGVTSISGLTSFITLGTFSRLAATVGFTFIIGLTSPAWAQQEPASDPANPGTANPSAANSDAANPGAANPGAVTPAARSTAGATTPAAILPPTVETLSLEQAIELGIKRSEDVQIAVAELERADAQIREAWAAAFPQVGASVAATRYLEAPVIRLPGPEGSFQEFPIRQDWEVSMGLQAEQVLWAFGRVGNALDLAKIGKSLTEMSLENAQRELRYQVILTYYRVQSFEDLMQIAQESLVNAQANKRSLESRFRGGRVPQYDNIKMLSDIASREPTLADAKKRVDLAYLQLNLLLDLQPGSRPKLTTEMGTEFPTYSLGALMDQAKANDVNLKLARGAKEVAEAQLDLEKSQRLPILSAVLGVKRDGTGPSIDIDQENYSNTVSAGVVLNIPIWEGGAHGARQRQARVDIVQAEHRLEKYKQELRLQLESALESYRADVEKYKVATRAQDLARQTYLLTRTRFQTGGTTQKDLNDVEMGLTGSKIQVQQTLMSIHEAQAQVQRLVDEVNTL